MTKEQAIKDYMVKLDISKEEADGVAAKLKELGAEVEVK